MTFRWIAIPLLWAVAAIPSGDACAAPRGFGPDTDNAPSVFSYGFRGLGIGFPVGLATGYLVSREGEWDGAEWRGLVTGAGIGAISGSVVGLGVGLYDLRQRRPGVGMVILRDTWYGTLLGASVGLITGAVVFASGGDAEHLAQGAAWGTLIGAPVGTVIGIIEGPTVLDAARAPDPSSNVVFLLAPVQDTLSAPLTRRATPRTRWIPALAGTF